MQRDRLDGSALEKGDIQDIVARHLDMYLTAAQIERGREGALHAKGLQGDTHEDDRMGVKDEFVKELDDKTKIEVDVDYPPRERSYSVDIEEIGVDEGEDIQMESQYGLLV
jgi:hypothetical protein